MIKTLDSNYAKEKLKQVDDNATQLNAEGINMLLSLLEDFGDLFDGTLGYWDNDPVDLEINPDSKPMNSKYYPVPRINKENPKRSLNAYYK